MVDHSESTTIHVHIIGPMPAESVGRKRYCLTMFTAPHQYFRADLMRSKTDVADYIYDFEAWADRNAEYKIKLVRCDNAPEFIALRKGLRELGTELTTASTYTLVCNSLAEKQTHP